MLIILYMLRLILVTLVVGSVFALSQPIDFNYTKHGADWTCPKNGSKQSPIALSSSQKIQKQKESHLFGDYTPSPGTANFLPTTVYINTADSFGSVYTKLMDGTSVPFKATEIRIRMHSEHQIEGKFYDLEVQVFHTELYPTNRNYRFAIGLLFQVGDIEDRFVGEIIKGYEKNTTATAATIQVDLSYLVPTNVVDDYWFYTGSATIPPCNQGKINWAVSRKISSISREQKQKLIQILRQGREDWDGNWRELQAQNTNIVGFRHIEQIQSIL